MSSVKLAIVGSRSFHDKEKFKLHLQNWVKTTGKNPDVIISGGANGVDKLAKNYANENKIEYKEFPADWDKFGLSAGRKRNLLIANECTHCLALPSRTGKGTQITIEYVNSLNKPIMIKFID